MQYFENAHINNNDLHSFYEQYRCIVAGSRTLNDALFYIKNLNISPTQKILLTSYANSLTYPKILDYSEFFEACKDIDNIIYKDDAYEFVNQIMRKTTDIAQIKCLARKANKKQDKPKYINIPEIDQYLKHYISKSCPHCGHLHRGSSSTNYVVCGYGTKTGHDWDGCGHDWCFKCNKLLCKSWTNDQLFIPENRIHNHECCKKHADMKKKNYLEDYCQCHNEFVNRTTIMYDLR